MKICMLVNTNYLGDRRVMKEAQSLRTAGYKVTVVANRNWKIGAENLSIKKAELIDGVKVVPVDIKLSQCRFNLWKKFYNNLIYPFLLENLFYRKALTEKAEAYHAHDLDVLKPAAEAAKKIGAKLIYDSHEYFTGVKHHFFNRYRWPKIEKKYIKKADAIITVCDLFADELAREYRIKRPIVIHNCAQKQQYQERNYIREKFDLSPDKKILLYLGCLMPNRGIEELLDMTKFLNDDIYLIFAGPISNKNYENLINEYSKNNSVLYLGPIPLNKVYEVMMSADIGLLFYNNAFFAHNSLSNKLFDYMMAGLPIMAVARSETHRLINEVRCGKAFFDVTPQNLAQEINKLIDNPTKLEYFHRNALKYAQQKYNWEEESQKLINIYKNF